MVCEEGMMGQSYREDCNEAKAARQGIVEQRPARPVAKKEKPFMVEYRRHPRQADCGLFRRFTEWRKWGNYRTADEAQKVIDLQTRKHPTLWQFRLKP
jgi:hypothetical protein